MSPPLDEALVRAELTPLLRTPGVSRGLANLTGDRFFVAFFLASVSQGEGLGEAAVGMIGQDELAARIHGLEQQREEERGHHELSIDVARSLFPEFFQNGGYCYAEALEGAPYYLAVLQRNRERLKRAGRYSRLNLYLTTTFAYEVMVVLLYRAVADAIGRSALPAEVRERVAAALERILEEEEGHLGVLDQHAALLATPRGDLSSDALAMLDALGGLSAEDYRVPAEQAVRQVALMMEKYQDAAGYRAQIEERAARAAS